MEGQQQRKRKRIMQQQQGRRRQGARVAGTLLVRQGRGMAAAATRGHWVGGTLLAHQGRGKAAAVEASRARTATAEGEAEW